MIDRETYRYYHHARALRNEAGRESVPANTRHYIECYLDPAKDWNEETISANKIKQLLSFAAVDWEKIKAHILSMPYEQFLKTPYWLAICEYKKRQSRGACQICMSKKELHTHHRNYDVHGDEIHHLHDLTVLCSTCHSKFHGKGEG